MQVSIFVLVLAILTASCASRSVSVETAGYKGHGVDSVYAKTIEKFAPPPLPPETLRFVEKIFEVQSPGSGMLTPDGKAMFFSWAVTGTSQVWKLDGPMRFPVQMTSGSEPTAVIEVSPDGKFVLISRDQGGEENPGIYILPVGGGALVEVFRKKGVRASAVWISNDGETVFYLANDIQPDSFALYAYSVEKKTRELLFSEPGNWAVGDVTNDRVFLLAKRTGALTREYYRWDLADKKLVPVIGQGELEEYGVRFGPREGEYIVQTSKLGEFKRLYSYRGGKLTPITPDVKSEVEAFGIDYQRRRIYVQWNDQGRSRLQVLHSHTHREEKLPEFKDAMHVTAVKLSRFGRYVSLSIGNADRPSVSYVWDWETRNLTQWNRGGMPEVDPAFFVGQSLEHYPARDGTKVPMWVTRPKKCATDPCPVIVHFHGGPEGQSRPGFGRVGQMLAMAGFVFVEPNVRGSTGYGRSWLRADDGVKRLDVITDIEDAAKYIRANWGKDGKPPRIGVMGGSYGGYSTLMAMSRFAGAYDVGVASFAMSNLRTFLLNTASYRRSLRTSEYGDPEKDKETLEKLSPTSYIDDVKGPLMILQGVGDPRVPVGEAIQMHELLQKRGVKAPLILFPSEGHGAAKRDNQVLQYGHLLKFFQENLLK